MDRLIDMRPQMPYSVGVEGQWRFLFSPTNSCCCAEPSLALDKPLANARQQLFALEAGMKEIPLTRGYVALVDDEDYERVAQIKWCVHVKPYTCYAQTTIQTGKVRKIVWMHRLIMNPPRGVLIDHIDRNGLNNTRANMRLATRSQNAWYRKKVPGSSQYRGVSWHKGKKIWEASIRLDGQRYYLGRFENEEDGARAYDAAARKMHGEFASLNFPAVMND